MYKHEYQGGPFVEVLSCQGKDPFTKWKIVNGGSGGVAQRVYDKDVKGFIFDLEGSTATSKMQLPKDGNKQSLGLTQKFINFQVFIPAGKDFAIELSMLDTTNSRRRLLMSTSIRDISMTPLHAKLNLSLIKRNTWLNLCFDLASLLSEIFLKQTFKGLDAIVVSGNCKVRRIFTMRNQPPDTTDCEVWNGGDGSSKGYFQLENIPASLQFASTVVYTTQVINVKKIQSQLKSKGIISSTSVALDSSRNVPKTSARGAATSSTHIAFGTRVRLPSNESTSSNDRENSSVSRDSVNVSKKSNFKSEERSTKTNYAPINSSKRNVKNLQSQSTSAISSTASDTDTLRNPGPDLPISLVNIVDDLEAENDENFSPDDDPYDVFSFSSRPHMAHVIGTPPEQGRSNLHDDFTKDESLASPRHKNIIMERVFSNPQTSRSPKHSPLLQKSVRSMSSIDKKYNSQRYAPDVVNRSSMMKKIGKDGVKGRDFDPKVMSSLRDSDATLISSVDTLVDNSTNKENEPYPDDSLEGNSTHDERETGHHVSHQSITLSRKSLREIPQSNSVPTEAGENIPLRVGSWSDSFEGRMLYLMKKEQEEDGLDEDNDAFKESLKDGLANGRTLSEDNAEESYDASWSTWKQPPGMDSEAYAREMKGTIPSMDHLGTLELSLNCNNRYEMENLPSPPIVLPSERARQEKDVNLSEAFGMSDGSTVSGHSTSIQESDDEEMLDLMYDPCLNCYFDPRTGRYYELKG